ncbi:lipase member I-like [Pectinophora gossypiella]|uniref:Lipase domain-containing protein n=1 Tax=Pectinophora gossypiella TaxID=13191 RepID=A0A1E1WI38_PECGO|nr:lipase member I-like [Pectinophora gossypiella]
MGKILLCLAVIFLACYTCYGTDLGTKDSGWGQLNQYYVYSRDNTFVPKRIYPTLESADVDARDFRSKVVILVHDHGQSHASSFDATIRYALLAAEDVTIIVVDWSVVAGWQYWNSVFRADSVALNIAELIRVLLVHNRVTYANLHMIGFGLGAHVVAFAARQIDGGVVARITGLNPSVLQGAFFHDYLKRGDAVYVEVIHTDGDGIGMGTPIGNVDFFPNGGTLQPGCGHRTIDNECNHRRAYELFAASIHGVSLIGQRCPQNVEISSGNCRGYDLAMGENVLIKYGSGSFYVDTSNITSFEQLYLLTPEIPDSEST